MMNSDPHSDNEGSDVPGASPSWQPDELVTSGEATNSLAEVQLAEAQLADGLYNPDIDDAMRSMQEVDDEEDMGLPPVAPVDGEMDITPMIDIVFLLLIFFIVSSKMTAEPTYPLPAAKNGAAIPVKNCVVLTVKRGGGDNAVISKADGTLFSDDLDQQAAEIAEYIQLGFDMQKSEILIRAEGGVRSGEINRIKEMVSESLEEGQMINFGVLQEG
jgi:biopolymer transport protein ExbD